MAEDRRIDELVADASAEILESIGLLLRIAHRKGIRKKEDAIEYVTNTLFAQLMRNPDFEDIIKTREGRGILRNAIKVEVNRKIRERRGLYDNKRKEIITSDVPAELKRKKLYQLERMFFGEKEAEEIRKEKEDEEKERKEFEGKMKEVRRRILREEARERRKGIFEAEVPWEEKGFEDLSLGQRERLREGWYKKQRKEKWEEYKKKRDEYKEKHGFWKRKFRPSETKDDRESLKKDRMGTIKELRKARAAAYGGWRESSILSEEELDRYEELKEKGRKGRSKEEKEEFKELKSKVRKSRFKRFARGANRAASAPGKFAKSAKGLVMKGFILACFVGIGSVATVAIGLPLVFFLGFLGWGIFYLLPHPDEFKIPDEVKELSEDNPLRWYMVNPFSKRGMYVRNARTGWGILRSVVKILVFFCFIFGVYTSAVPLGNIALIILSFFGYYSLKITYDVEKPYELIESIIRFGGLGFYFIPWIIMYGIFDSMLLAFIAMAFFAIPPIPKERKNSELFMMYDFYDKIIFGIIMLGVLIGFLLGWEVSATLSATFIYFWFVTGIAGFFSPAEARPAMGFLMLGAATIIYGIGPGTQEVMSGLFGPWWPTIQNTFQSISEPISEAFGGLTNTLRSGWLLLTDPVGYATQLMNGTHAENPLGRTGAFGVEITDVTISPIFPEQPFVITAMIENRGTLNAENVTMYLSTGYEAPREKKPTPLLGPLLLFVPKAHRPDTLKFGEMFGMEDDRLVVCHGMSSADFEQRNACVNEMEKQNIWQEVFTSSSGISCDVIEQYDLREKSIPIKVQVTYNYSSDSQVDVEFISQNEWQRLAESNQLNQKLRFIQSQYSTAPVEFPIGTPGLKNPILAGQPFHLGIRIEPSGTKGSIDHIHEIVLDYPSDFELDGMCTPKQSQLSPETVPGLDFKRLRWENLSGGGARVIYCPFKPLSEDKLKGPTKTYVVMAHAEYTFTGWKERDTKIEFGGKCCSEKDCLKGQICSDGMCIPKSAATAEELCPGRCEEGELDAAIDAAIAKYNVSRDLVSAIMQAESFKRHCSGDHVQMSTKGAVGIMQLMSTTADEMGVDICDFEDNIEGGVRYLYNNLQAFRDYEERIRFAIAAYNCGTKCVSDAIRDHGRGWDDMELYLPVETQAYVINVCSIYGKCVSS